MLPAPARLSMTTCWPSTSPSLPLSERAIVSTGPPGTNGTMNRTGFTGYWACAQTGSAAATATIKAG